jgi:hypothetical protein
MALRSDDIGVHCEARLDGRQTAARDLAIAVERGDVTQMSCGFVVDDDDWGWDDAGDETRDIYSLQELFDVSAVTYPASPTTSIALTERALRGLQPLAEGRDLRTMWAVAKDIRAGRQPTQGQGQELMDALVASTSSDIAHLREVTGRDETMTRERLLMRSMTIYERCYRQGKVLSSEIEQMLQAAQDALHSADDIDIPGITTQLEAIDKALDAGQAGLSAVLGKANPDGGPGDKEPALVAAGSPAADADARSRQRQQLSLQRTRLQLAG